MINQLRIKALFQSIGSILVFFLIATLLSQFKALLPIKFNRYADGTIGTIAAMSAVWIFLRFEKKSIKSIGLTWDKKSFYKFLIGLLMGITIATIMISALVIYSNLEVTLNEGVKFSSFLIWALALVPLAFMEEVAFRSYSFIQLNKVFGLRITQFVLAIMFALYHVAMGWDIGAAFVGPGIWAFTYGLIAIASNGVAMPTGFHFGLNFILAFAIGKKEIDSMLIIDFSGEVSKSVQQANETFGIILQILILVLGLIGTEIFIKRNKKSSNDVYQ